MNCKFHPTAEAVTTCATCGAGMCSQCETGAFFRMESGQPLCIECSLKEAEENVVFGERYLKRMKRKLVFASIFFVLAIVLFIEGETGSFQVGILLWFLSGLVQTWGHEKDGGGIKSAIWSSSNRDETVLSKIIFYVFAAPVMLIRNFIRYPKLKDLHQVDVQKYEEIKATMGNAN